MLCPTEPQHLPRLLLVPSSDGEISVEALQELAKDAPHKNLAVAEDVVGDEEEKARENKYEEEHHTRPRDDDGIDSVMRERSISADSQPQRRQQQQQQQLQIRVVFKRRQIYNLSQGEEAQTGVNSSNNNINPTERETIQVSLKQLQDSNSLICTIEYSSRIGAFRALGSVMTRIWASSLSNNSTSSNNNLNFTETFSFKNNGVMIDCSRCAVLKLSTVKMLLRRMSLMGMNTLQLYTEDTYEISGEPMFGFLRGRYSLSELRVIDGERRTGDS